MVKWVASFIISFTVQFVAAQSDSVYIFSYFKNNGEDGLHLAYSNDGYKWMALRSDRSFLKPMVANDKLMRDPCIIRGADSLFHMVWTVSWNDKGIGYANSPDLLKWSEQQFIPVMSHEDSALNCWAPEIIYDKNADQYMIYWATTIPGRFIAGESSGDSKYNHRMYFTTTKDFKNFSKTQVLYDHGFNVIDASIVYNGGKYFMFLKDETRYPPQKNIRLATSRNLSGPYSKPKKPITGNYWAEGPTIIKIGEEWVVYFDKYRDHQYGAVASRDMINWMDISDKLQMPAGMRHGSVLKISAKEFGDLIK